MTPPFNPDSWLDLVAYLILGIPAIISAFTTVRSRQENKENHAEQRDVAKQTLSQVQNDHKSNLRDDIDRLTEAVKEGFAGTRREFNHLREELRQERVERIEGDRNQRLLHEAHNQCRND